ncbi:DUF2157 domain-containing protein [Modestobacter sp. I12A-02628]|uniref:DUF2157 domain-containing protein n=1 Tax=Goekera deserti TaxID=2497753 RepID=A0A7K3WD49_9ACTN|nr:DUF2157 domain-containing protein [Goekera deserti]MPQ96843.1 DUF2157 domain-containing protein [Goekera deserti]NDI46843.1 DUF2157 domain-containing protein [Goekera deserti]NEL54411.1 DUF2157 domain-containing protein [Goekera deserti]
MVFPNPPAWVLSCPVCGAPVPRESTVRTGSPAGTVPPSCARCGLPAVGQAGLVVARIGSTLAELTRDRDALLSTLSRYAAAPGQVPARTSRPATAAGPPTAAGPATAAPLATAPGTATTPGTATAPGPGPWPQPAAPAGGPYRPPTPRPDAPAGPPTGARPPAGPPPAHSGPHRDPSPANRLSPQQVLLGLGATLLVTAALAFVAVGWTRFGLVFQAGTMLVVTTAAAGTSAWAARRGLRATEEALAVTAGALVAIDLWAVRTLGLFGADAIGLRPWSAVALTVTAGIALAAGRLTPSTITWPVVALAAVQPLPLVLLPPDVLVGPAGVAALLGLAATDLALVGLLRPALTDLARALALTAGALGAIGGVAVAWSGSRPDAWGSTAVVLLGSAAAVLLQRRGAGVPGDGATPTGPVAAVLTSVAVLPSALALAGALVATGDGGALTAGLLAVTALLAGVLGWHRAGVAAGAGTAATVLGLAGTVALLAADRPGLLAVATLAVTGPGVVAAVRVPVLRSGATAVALLAPGAAVLLTSEADVLGRTQAGLLLALLAATALTVAGLRTGRAEEVAAAASGALLTLAAAASSGSTGATGQVALQLAVVGAAGVGYWAVSGRRLVLAVAVADLLVALWTALGGANVDTPEAYTLPAALGLLLLTGPWLRTRPWRGDGPRPAPGGSWAVWGPALLVAAAPSVLLVMAGGSAVRLVLVVLAATAAVVAGALTHRQAPFVVGGVSLVLVVLAELAPYAPLVPRWLSLGAAGLVLLAVGATYEQRRAQAREAVAWVGQMR